VDEYRKERFTYMRHSIGVIQYGLGPIGQAIVRDLMKKGGIRIVGAIDIDTKKAGKDLGELVGLNMPLGVTVSSDPTEVLSNGEAEIVILSTLSSFESCYSQIETIVGMGKHLISTCEELAYPWQTHPDLSAKIDRIAQDKGVAVLGTGVNPGFLMDYLPVVVSGLCREIDRIRVFRIQDASRRRFPFQQKIGSGLTKQEFETRRLEKKIRHVGMTESVHMIGRGFGWEIERTEDEIYPVLAETNVESDFIKVAAGDVKGMRQVGKGFRNGTEVITLEMVMTLGQDSPQDVVEIDGTPNIRLGFQGGIHGDIATAAVVVNSIPPLLRLSPGLKTMLDLPPVRFYTEYPE
jgi:4-hydroxy-tetrahydrodipicolinate reductase